MDTAIYLGTWTNWSRGPIFGSTLTTTKDVGNLLIAFTAFFVAIVATRFWRICCLLLHMYLSTSEPRDAIHHQRQVSNLMDNHLQWLIRLRRVSDHPA
jgi:hypothetical protein